MDKLEIVYCKQTTQVEVNGGLYTVYGGAHYAADDQVVLAAPHLFSSDPRTGMMVTDSTRDYGDIVETATARPGEKRAQVHRG